MLEINRDRADLQKAINALEGAGFHVDRAYEETNRDAGNTNGYASYKTGAICLRIAPPDNSVTLGEVSPLECNR
jgi:hypothetical protein